MRGKFTEYAPKGNLGGRYLGYQMYAGRTLSCPRVQLRRFTVSRAALSIQLHIYNCMSRPSSSRTSIDDALNVHVPLSSHASGTQEQQMLRKTQAGFEPAKAADLFKAKGHLRRSTLRSLILLQQTPRSRSESLILPRHSHHAAALLTQLCRGTRRPPPAPSPPGIDPWRRGSTLPPAARPRPPPCLPRWCRAPRARGTEPRHRFGP